ncbi:low molecular weight protein arginine phosphatase [Paenibacillus thalictri]|uniref:Low molecular weight protein arginine phosphatase n=1 Tax=Paenibacillus thalictri TaxID=2527873 RepID=A0A4Q9DJ69_9BACL|nr:low molecular weight protein arginine phosphatase [Paenibacillus thalictri]TBL72941.1 low molecular weight protein arginine phosphatase [Paenibacillus thalictri]
MKRILFVCTGNTCRSPLAEGMLRLLAAEQGLELEVKSAGVAANEGAPASRHTVHILREKGFTAPLSSSSLTESLASWADVILTMTSSHKRYAVQKFPESVDKIHSLGEFVEDDQNVLDAIEELAQLEAELQVKAALSEPITQDELARLRELQRKLPDYDIADPFGGSLDLYRQSAVEIERSLLKLLKRLKSTGEN